MQRKSLRNVAALVGTLVGLSACSVDMPQQVQTSFETLTVQKSDIELPYKFSARMKGQNDVTVTPQVNGQLMRICVTEGQSVKQGQTLFIIDSRNAQLELEAAEANLQAALAQENSAKLEYDSNKNLFDKKIVSSYMLTNSENSYKQAQAAVAQARAAVNRAKVNLGFCTIKATVSGVIGEIPVRVGDQVSPMTQLTLLSGNTTMHAEFSLTEGIIEAQVQHGFKASDIDMLIANLPPATFVMKNGTEYPHKGHFVSMTGVVNAETGSMTCKVSFPNPDGILYSGIQGNIVMSFVENDVIVIPQSSVVRLQDKSLVYKVLPDSTATAVDVTIQDTGNGKDFIAKEGLSAGDRIVASGANHVTDGQKVLFPEKKK